MSISGTSVPHLRDAVQSLSFHIWLHHPCELEKIHVVLLLDELFYKCQFDPFGKIINIL